MFTIGFYLYGVLLVDYLLSVLCDYMANVKLQMYLCHYMVYYYIIKSHLLYYLDIPSV